MSLTFAKLFSSITDSSIWAEPDPIRIVWITMLSMADQYGDIFASELGLANRARVDVTVVEAALLKFQQPDKYSRTKANNGKRIEVIEGGWRLLNYEHYRELRSQEDRKERNRLAQQRRRDRIKERHQIVINRHQSSSMSSQADANANANTDNKESLEDFAKNNNLPVTIPKRKRKPKREVVTELIIPASLQTEDFKKAWSEWIPFRIQLKEVKNYNLTFQKQLSILEKMGPSLAIEALNNSIQNEWQGVFPPKTFNHSKPESKIHCSAEDFLKKEEAELLKTLNK